MFTYGTPRATNRNAALTFHFLSMRGTVKLNMTAYLGYQHSHDSALWHKLRTHKLQYARPHPVDNALNFWSGSSVR